MIPGVQTVHLRAAWEDPNLPVNDPPEYVPPRQDWSRITTGVAHYTAAVNLPDGDLGEFEYNIPPYLRAIQRDYRTNKGFSIGYLWAVDWLGGAWQLRGWEWRAAANLGRLAQPVNTANYWTIPVLYLVDGNDPMTDEALATGRAIYREAGRIAGRKLIGPVPHSHIDPTGCCGDGIRGQITAGLLNADYAPPTPQPPEDDMEYVTLGGDPLYMVTSDGCIRWVSPELWARLGRPAPSRVLTADQAKALLLVGPAPDFASVFADQVA